MGLGSLTGGLMPSTSTSSLLGSMQQSGSGGMPQGVPATMEELLERQWEQGSSFVISNSHFDGECDRPINDYICENIVDFNLKKILQFFKKKPNMISKSILVLSVAQLLSCLHQLKKENSRLEDTLSTMIKRRDHLLALNARLAMPLGVTAAGAAGSTAAPAVPAAAAPAPTMHSPAAVAAAAAASQMQPGGMLAALQQQAAAAAAATPQQQQQAPPPASEDSLQQLRSLAAGGRAPAGNDRSRASNNNRNGQQQQHQSQQQHHQQQQQQQHQQQSTFGAFTSGRPATSAASHSFPSIPMSSASNSVQSPSFPSVSQAPPTNVPAALNSEVW